LNHDRGRVRLDGVLGSSFHSPAGLYGHTPLHFRWLGYCELRLGRCRLWGDDLL